MEEKLQTLHGQAQETLERAWATAFVKCVLSGSSDIVVGGNRLSLHPSLRT